RGMTLGSSRLPAPRVDVQSLRQRQAVTRPLTSTSSRRRPACRPHVMYALCSSLSADQRRVCETEPPNRVTHVPELFCYLSPRPLSVSRFLYLILGLRRRWPRMPSASSQDRRSLARRRRRVPLP